MTTHRCVSISGSCRDDDVDGVGFADGEGERDRADEGVRISVSNSRRVLEDSEGDAS